MTFAIKRHGDARTGGKDPAVSYSGADQENISETYGRLVR